LCLTNHYTGAGHVRFSCFLQPFRPPRDLNVSLIEMRKNLTIIAAVLVLLLTTLMSDYVTGIKIDKMNGQYEARVSKKMNSYKEEMQNNKQSMMTYIKTALLPSCHIKARLVLPLIWNVERGYWINMYEGESESQTTLYFFGIEVYQFQQSGTII
jgi:hypothetical protein